MIVELALALTLQQAPPEHPGGDRWFSADKVKHFFLAGFVQHYSFGTLRSVGMDRRSAFVGATAVSVAVSVGKEVSDRRRGGAVSPKDLAWDFAGMVAATLVLRRTR